MSSHAVSTTQRDDHPRVKLYEAIQGLSDEQVLYTLDLLRSIKRDKEAYRKMTPDPDEPPLSAQEEKNLEISSREIQEGKAVPFEIAMKELC